MSYQGDYALGSNVDFGFTTTSASTGAPTTLSGVPVLSAYVGNSTTELTAGITLTVDFDTRTGYNHVRVVATSGNGYAAGTDIDIVVTTGTVGGTSAVGYVVGSFSIENRVSNLTKILGTAVSTPATAGILDVNVKNINNAAAATPGASGGLHINGSNSGTTTYAALTVTGSLTISDGLLVSRSTSNASAATFTGNGTGSGAVFTSGAGATGDGVQMTAGSTNGNGLKLTKAGSGSDFNATVTPLVLAKTTNLTGLNDIAATAVVSAGAITTSSGAVSNVTLTATTTNLTNAPPDSSGVTTLLSRLSAARAGVIDALSVRTGTAQAGAASTITLDASASATDNLYKDQWVVITSGTGAGQARLITGYVGSTKVATVERAWATNPDNTSVFYMLTAAGIAHVVLTDTTTAVTNSVTAGTVSDKTGYALTAAYDAAKTAMASYTQPTGFLAATFPTTVASTTNITAASGVALTAAYDLAKTAAQAGDAMALVAGAVDSTAIDSTGANEVADALLDRSAAIETGLTPRGALRLIAAEAVGNVTGLDTGSVVIKNAVANSKTRIAATGDAASRTITSTDVT